MSDKMTASPSSGVIQPDFLVSFMLLSTVGAVLFVSLGLPWGGGAKLKSSVYCLVFFCLFVLFFFCLVFISPRAYVRLSHPLAPLCLSLTHTYTLCVSSLSCTHARAVCSLLPLHTSRKITEGQSPWHSRVYREEDKRITKENNSEMCRVPAGPGPQQAVHQLKDTTVSGFQEHLD